MAPSINSMKNWNEETENQIALILKDWLKQKGITQAELSKRLKSSSSRMPSILEILEQDFNIGGIQKVCSTLCLVEEEFENSNINCNATKDSELISNEDPFDQLDLLLEKINEDFDPNV